MDPTGIHPFLAQGTRRGDSFEVTRLAEDVEDMQIAYGIDGIITGAIDNALTVQPPVPPGLNVDPNVSTAVGGDEWVPNVDRRRPPSTPISSSSSRSSRGTRARLSRSTARASTA